MKDGQPGDGEGIRGVNGDEGLNTILCITPILTILTISPPQGGCTLIYCSTWQALADGRQYCDQILYGGCITACNNIQYPDYQDLPGQYSTLVAAPACAVCG